jgi:hypothetical protein
MNMPVTGIPGFPGRDGFAMAQPMNQAQRLDALHAMYRQSEIDLASKNQAYAAARLKLGNKLNETGFRPEEIETLFEAYERMWNPLFGAAGSRLPGNDAARRLHDAANRAGVSPEEWQLFVASVNDYRQAENRSNRISGELYENGGSDRMRYAKTEVDALLQMKTEIVRAARRMNPNIDITAVHRLVEDGKIAGPARFDPLRRTIAFALDPTQFNVRREAYSALWNSVSGMLTEKERQVLAQKFAPNASSVPNGWAVASEKAADAFAAHMAPGREKRSNIAVFKRLERFFGRVNNAARGLGFQVAEDVWKRASEGEIAGRKQSNVIELADRNRDRAAYETVKSALHSSSDFDLIRMKETQLRELDKARREHTALWRRLVVYNPASRGFHSIVNYFSPSAQDPLKADRARVQNLMRGLGAINSEINGRSRNRSEQQLDLAAGPASGPSSPGPNSPGPSSPGPNTKGPGPETRATRGDSAPGQVVEFPNTGRHGRYELERAVHGPEGFDFQVKFLSPDGMDTTLAYARNSDAAQTCVDAFERVAGEGRATNTSRNLADLANRSGTSQNLDIRAIRDSGLLDPQLDRRIGEMDVHALVYPLKTGDLIFCGKDGQWRAASVKEFIQYAAVSGDQHIENAAKVISLDAERAARSAVDRDRSGVGPAPQAMEPTQTTATPNAMPSDQDRQIDGIASMAGSDQRAAQTREEPTAPALNQVAARIVQPDQLPQVTRDMVVPAPANAHPPDPTRGLQLDPSSTDAEKRALLRDIPNEQLQGRYQDTMAALATTNSASRRLELDTGRTALEVVMKERGVWQRPLEGKPAPAPGVPRRKDSGPEIS